MRLTICGVAITSCLLLPWASESFVPIRTRAGISSSFQTSSSSWSRMCLSSTLKSTTDTINDLLSHKQFKKALNFFENHADELDDPEKISAGIGIIKSCLKGGQPLIAKDVLLELVERFPNKNRPSENSWRHQLVLHVLNGMRQHPKWRSPVHLEEAQFFLRIKCYDAKWYGGYPPNRIDLNKLLNKWAEHRDRREGSRRVNFLLSWMENHDDPIFKPDIVSYNTVIHKLTARRSPNATYQAEAFLRRMLEQSRQGCTGAEPNRSTYNSVLYVWAQTGGMEATQRAEEILLEMEQSENTNCRPDHKTYSSVIHAWAKSGAADAGFRAESILSRMIERHREGLIDSEPDRICFNAVVNAWAKTGGVEAAERAEELLNKMEQSKDANLQPNERTYSSVIDAWAKSGAQVAGKRAEDILQRMIKRCEQGLSPSEPDGVNYSAVINAWAKTGGVEAAERAEEILHQMEDADDPKIRPNHRAYSSVVDAWAKCGTRDAGPRAESMLKRMIERHGQGLPSAIPTEVTYGAVANAWAKTGGAEGARRSEKMLVEMEKFNRPGVPSKPCYETVITAWTGSGAPEAQARAAIILSRMLERYNENATETESN